MAEKCHDNRDSKLGFSLFVFDRRINVRKLLAGSGLLTGVLFCFSSSSASVADVFMSRQKALSIPVKLAHVSGRVCLWIDDERWRASRPGPDVAGAGHLVLLHERQCRSEPDDRCAKALSARGTNVDFSDAIMGLMAKDLLWADRDETACALTEIGYAWASR